MFFRELFRFRNEQNIILFILLPIAMNRMEGIRFTQKRQNTRSFLKMFGGKSYAAARAHRHSSSQVTSAMGIPFPFLGAFFSKLKFRVFCYS